MKDRRELRDLDDRVVPVLAARVGQWRISLLAWWERLVAGLRGLNRDSAPSLDVRSLRRLDERYTTSGPLGLLREIPQLGFILIGLVFLVGTGTAVSREAARNRATQEATDPLPEATSELPGQEGEVSTTLGPAVGDEVLAYQATATRSLAEARRDEGSRLALVSLRSYLTPGQVKELFTGYNVQRVYLRSRSGGKDAAQLPVNVTGDLGKALVKAYADAAHGRAVAQGSYQGYVNTLTVVTKEDQSFKDLYASFAASTGREAHDYRSSCACVYAAVVSATPQRLAELTARASVRAVQVAGKGLALQAIEVLPLLPEVTGIVPAAQAPVDPP